MVVCAWKREGGRGTLFFSKCTKCIKDVSGTIIISAMLVRSFKYYLGMLSSAGKQKETARKMCLHTTFSLASVTPITPKSMLKKRFN